MIIFAREDNNQVLQASTRANEQAGGIGGVERRDGHLENTSTDPSADWFQIWCRGKGGLAGRSRRHPECRGERTILGDSELAQPPSIAPENRAYDCDMPALAPGRAEQFAQRNSWV